MMRRVAYAVCAGLCFAYFAASARADVTYTWETLSSYAPPPSFLPTFHFSFTVAGPVSVDADSNFAPPSNLPIPYQFPPNLLAFNVLVEGFPAITLSDFTSQCNVDYQPNRCVGGVPVWTLGLDANPADLTGDLSLFFIDRTDTYGISSIQQGSLGQASTNGVETMVFGSDDGCSGGCTYTGILVATVAEPSSLWVLIAGLATLGLIRRRPGLTSALAS